MEGNKKYSELQQQIMIIEEALTKAISIVKKEKEIAVKNHQFKRAASARDVEKPLEEAQQILFPKKELESDHL